MSISGKFNSQMKVVQNLTTLMIGANNWVVIGRGHYQRLRPQEEGGGIVIWAGIRGIMVGPWRVPDGTKITADDYITFFKEHLDFRLQKAKNHHRIYSR